MANKIRVALNITQKEADRFLESIGLSSMLESILNDEQLRRSFEELQMLECYPLNKTMPTLIKGKKTPMFHGSFEKFQESFSEYLHSYILGMFFNERMKSPLKSDSVIADLLRLRQDEIKERTISLAYNQLLYDINYEHINRGCQPFVQ